MNFEQILSRKTGQAVPQDDRKVELVKGDELLYKAQRSCLSDEGGICWDFLP
jgi:hypothetical protein